MSKDNSASSDEESGQDGVRDRIIAAGNAILAEGGRDALTTRAVAAAAGVQAPTIYRLFGDKDGLLDAVAEHGFAKYVARKNSTPPLDDPLDDLRHGWDVHVEFGLTHPAIFSIINGDPRPGRRSTAQRAGLENLEGRIGRLAAAGLLRISERRAVEMVHAAGIGAVLTLLGMPEERRDLELSMNLRETVIASIVSFQPILKRPKIANSAVTLRAQLDGASTITPGERLLLIELLDRLADHPS